MTGEESGETIQLVVLNSVLYGAAKAVDYLGRDGQVMLDKIGEGILDYLVKEGYIEDLSNLEKVRSANRRFFQENGYISDIGYVREADVVTITYRGWQYLDVMKKLRSQGCSLYACPFCLAGESILRVNSIVAEPISEYFLPDGAYVRKLKLVRANADTAPSSMLPSDAPDLSMVRPDHDRKVGLGAFEAVEYGLARGFAFLGAQAQLLLDSIGRGIVEFLQDELQLNLTKEHARSVQELASFYASRGLADKIEVHVSSSEARVEFMNYRYASVLKRLLDEGVHLVSCPFTLAMRTVLRNAGFAATEIKWRFDAGQDVALTMPLLYIVDKQFDEERVAGLMESA